MNSRALLKLFFILSLLICTSCTQDTTFIPQQETRVVVDSFVQSERLKELDILVSLDTSGSMNDNFADVATGMEILKTDIESLTLDYQFGYITMDPTNTGFLGPYNSNSNALDMLMAPGLLPSTFYEEGFAATYTFLSSEEGTYFSRPEADFLLFLISDEEEQSSITASLFQQWLQETFSEVNHDIVTIVQIEGSECGWGYNTGYKYEELSSLYNKSAIDICEEDWSVWLSESSYITQLQDYISLSEEDPIVKSIVVYIDQEITYNWEYVEEINTVQLDFIPDYGELVEVGYKINI